MWPAVQKTLCLLQFNARFTSVSSSAQQVLKKKNPKKYREWEEQMKLLSKHLESIHSQCGSRGRREGEGAWERGEEWGSETDREREGDTERARETHESAHNLFLAQANQVRARAPENAGITRVLELRWPGPPLLAPALHATLPC